MMQYYAHKERGIPEWVEDPFRGETKEEQKAKKKMRSTKGGSKGGGPSAEDDSDGDDNQGGSGGNRGGRGAGGSGGGAGGSGGGNDEGPGNGSSGGENGPRRSTRLKGASDRQQHNLSLDSVHLAFKASGHHLWSKGFSYFRRLVDTTAAAPNAAPLDLTPRAQDHGSPYLAGSRNVGATLGLNPSDQQRRASAGSTHSSRSTSSHTSVKSLFSENTPSSPTSPSTTASFAAFSRDSSPFPEKSAGLQTGSSEPTSAPVCNAGILIDGSLGKSAIGIVWSGNMILEDGNDDDYSIPVAVKMAIPRGRDNVDSEAETDERDTIRREGLVYDFLAKSGKEGITPRYYGVFEDSLGTVALVLDNGGAALKSFNNLPGERARKLFAKAEEMHSAGVRHNDFVPRNVVQDSEGNLKIIDFHIAKMGHRCRGKQECKELSKLSKALGL
ncbi:hypothetical protein GGX14DRAFT_557601 [Mycena pura]|uniref:Protein kinase domain-containing protein n=1 Tax=Mycena pura TaxID=153505 RepID=A0AAD6YLT2_9AGAR|nr:hypothetical protein GGX14DRAFT_557601 [Mycena pura]